MQTTFATAKGSKTQATSIIIEITCNDGSQGIGEVPTSFVVPHETTHAIKKTVREAKPLLYKAPVTEWAGLANKLRHTFPSFAMTCSGLETAMFRAHLASINAHEKLWWGEALNTITTDITVPFVPDLQTLTPWLQKAVQNGFDCYKVKVSGNVDEDASFIHSIIEYLSETEKPYTIRLDGNQGFTCDSALGLLDQLNAPVELFEQPLKSDDYQGMNQLCQKAPVQIIADETVFSVEDCKRVIDDELANGINIKIAKSGITQSRHIIKLAKKANLKLMIGCMTETITGLSAAIYCAMGTGAFDYIDLDSIHFLHHRKNYGNVMIDGPSYRFGKQL